MRDNLFYLPAHAMLPVEIILQLSLNFLAVQNHVIQSLILYVYLFYMSLTCVVLVNYNLRHRIGISIDQCS